MVAQRTVGADDVDRTPVVHYTFSDDDEPTVGEIVDHTYRIARRLGSGGMGWVFQALDLRLDREVALKIVSRQQLAGESAGERFLQEARVLARVHHPNVVEVHAMGSHRGRPYFVMELVLGPNLAVWHGSRPHPSLAEAIDVLDQACAGVDAIHASGAIHRDLKPANLIVGPARRVVVTDLGLAYIRGQTARPRIEELVGTPAYLAPELARGDPVTPDRAARLDVYSLGVVAFELLTGRRPFVARDAEEMIQLHARATPPPPSAVRSGLPAVFDAPILRALATDPRDRTPSIAALRSELLAAYRGVRPASRRPASGTAGSAKRPPEIFAAPPQSRSPSLRDRPRARRATSTGEDSR